MKATWQVGDSDDGCQGKAGCAERKRPEDAPCSCSHVDDDHGRRCRSTGAPREPPAGEDDRLVERRIPRVEAGTVPRPVPAPPVADGEIPQGCCRAGTVPRPSGRGPRDARAGERANDPARCRTASVRRLGPGGTGDVETDDDDDRCEDEGHRQPCAAGTEHTRKVRRSPTGGKGPVVVRRARGRPCPRRRSRWRMAPAPGVTADGRDRRSPDTRSRRRRRPRRASSVGSRRGR